MSPFSYRRTKASRTARLRPSSRVKRSRDQAQLAPRRRRGPGQMPPPLPLLSPPPPPRPARLVVDDPAVLALPLPGALHEFLAPQFLARHFVLAQQHLLDLQ